MGIYEEIMQACRKKAESLSTCKKAQVGSVILPTVGGQLIWDRCEDSIGVNWQERDKEEPWLPQRETFKPLQCGECCLCGKALHAEVDASLRYKRKYWHLDKVDYLTLITTHHPCANCLHVVLPLGVTRLVIAHSKPNDPEDSAALYQALEEGLLEEVRFVQI